MNFEKMAALGALGVTAGSMLAWLGLVFVTRPVASGGIDSVTHLALSAATFALFGMIAAAHLYLGLQLRHGPDSIRG